MGRLIPLLLISLLIFAGCSDFEETETGRFEYGVKLLKEGNKAEAENMFRAIDSLYPESPYGLYGLALIHDKEYLNITAAEMYFRLLDQHPDFLPGMRSFVDLAMRMEWYNLTSEMIINSRQAGLDPYNVDLLTAELYLKRGNIPSAGEILDSLASAGVDSVDFLLLQAEYYRHRAEFDKMFALSGQIAGRVAGDKHNLLKLGYLMDRVGLADSAAFYFDQANIVGAEDYYFGLDVAQAYCDIGYLENCDKILTRLEQVNPDSHRMYLLKRNRLLAVKRYFDAIKVTMKELRNNHDKPSAMQSHAYVSKALGDLANTHRFYDNAGITAESDSFNVVILNKLSLDLVNAIVELGAWTEALVMYARYKDRVARDFRALRLYADMHYTAGLDSVAESFVDEMQPIIKNNSQYKAELGDLFVREEFFDRARELLESALSENPVNPTAIKGMAGLIGKEQNDSASIEFLDSVNIYATSHDSLYPYYLNLLAETGQLDMGRSFIDRLVEMGPRDIMRYREGMDFYKSLKSREDLKGLVDKLLEYNGNADESHVLAAEFYLEQGDAVKAEEHARKALAQSEENDRARMLLARAYEAKGEPELAIPIYREIIEKDKLNGPAHGYLARALITTGGDPGEIMMGLRTAIKFDRDPIHKITLTRYQMQQGQYRGAMRTLEMAIKQDSTYGPYYYYAARAADGNEMPEKARNLLELGLKRDMPDSLRTEAESFLDSLSTE